MHIHELPRRTRLSIARSPNPGVKKIEPSPCSPAQGLGLLTQEQGVEAIVTSQGAIQVGRGRVAGEPHWPVSSSGVHADAPDDSLCANNNKP